MITATVYGITRKFYNSFQAAAWIAHVTANRRTKK
jgi:hypothetical protein